MKDGFDLRAFWQENAECFAPFSTQKPRAPLSFIFEDHFLINLVTMESTIRYYTEPSYALDANRAANDILEREIGARVYAEDRLSYVKGGFEVILGAKRILRERGTPWLETPVEDIADVKKLIRRMENMEMKSAIPEDWYLQRERLKEARGKRLAFTHSLNGPATLACNLLGTANLCVFMMEEPGVIGDFFRVAAEKYVEYYLATRALDGDPVTREGIGVNDDQCYIFPPKQYEAFCAPFMRRLFEEFAPLPGHRRGQHSDSNMGHLMPILNDLGVNDVNLGPELHPADIRRALPKAVIRGQMPPFVLRNGTAEEIEAVVRRDIECLGGDGGLVESLAGVVPESTPFENIRAYMRAVQTFGRYDDKT